VVMDAKSGRFHLQVPGEGQMEMPLVAEGLRKFAMLARLISTGALLDKGYLFWDEPETNLNPKLIRIVAKIVVHLASQGIQVFVATHSLFLLREFEVELDQRSRSSGVVPARFFGLQAGAEGVTLTQAEALPNIGMISSLEESLSQADRYIALGGNA
jgi:hypothetical protein